MLKQFTTICTQNIHSPLHSVQTSHSCNRPRVFLVTRVAYFFLFETARGFEENVYISPSMNPAMALGRSPQTQGYDHLNRCFTYLLYRIVNGSESVAKCVKILAYICHLMRVDQQPWANTAIYRWCETSTRQLNGTTQHATNLLLLYSNSMSKPSSVPTCTKPKWDGIEQIQWHNNVNCQVTSHLPPSWCGCWFLSPAHRNECWITINTGHPYCHRETIHNTQAKCFVNKEYQRMMRQSTCYGELESGLQM